MEGKNYSSIEVLKVITDLSWCLCHESLSIISPGNGTTPSCWGNEVGWAVCHIWFFKLLIAIYIYVQTNGDCWCFRELKTLVWKKYRIMHELPWIMIFGLWVSDLAIIFMSDEVMSENNWQIASRVTQKSLFTVMNVLFIISYRLFLICPEHTILLKTIIDHWFCHCR